MLQKLARGRPADSPAAPSLERSPGSPAALVADERAGVIGLQLCQGQLRKNLAEVPVRGAAGSAKAWRRAGGAATAINRASWRSIVPSGRTAECDNFDDAIQATRHGTGLDRSRSCQVVGAECQQ
jgi:hypothetical protein